MGRKMEKVKTSPEPRQSEMYDWDWIKEPKEAENGQKL